MIKIYLSFEGTGPATDEHVAAATRAILRRLWLFVVVVALTAAFVGFLGGVVYQSRAIAPRPLVPTRDPRPTA